MCEKRDNRAPREAVVATVSTRDLLPRVLLPGVGSFPAVRAVVQFLRLRQFRLRRAPSELRASAGAARNRAGAYPSQPALQKQSLNVVAVSRLRGRYSCWQDARARQQYLLRASSALLQHQG